MAKFPCIGAGILLWSQLPDPLAQLVLRYGQGTFLRTATPQEHRVLVSGTHVYLPHPQRPLS